MASSDTLTVLILSHLVPFLPFFEVIPEIFRNLLDERGRELYWEGIRRTDLVRFDLLTSGSYTWDFKGGINTGVGVNKRYNVYPIPVTDLTVNGNLQQNEGY